MRTMLAFKQNLLMLLYVDSVEDQSLWMMLTLKIIR